MVDDGALAKLREGRRVFRYDTFGDQAFWGGALKLHQAIAGAALGGVTGVIAGAAGLAARSAWVAALTGCALAVALGAGLTSWAWQAGAATYPPVRGRIDPGATDGTVAAGAGRASRGTATISTPTPTTSRR